VQAERDHRHMVAAGERELLLDLVAGVGRVREDQDDRPSGPQRLDDRLLIIRAGRDVARRNPALGATTFEGFADLQRWCAVRGRIADEDWAPCPIFLADCRSLIVHRAPTIGKRNVYGALATVRSE